MLDPETSLDRHYAALRANPCNSFRVVRDARRDEAGTAPYPFTGGFALPLTVFRVALDLVHLQDMSWGAGANIALAKAVRQLGQPILLTAASYTLP